MKKQLVLFVFAFSSFSLTQAKAQEAKTNEKAVIKTNIYCDHCKQCPSCGKRLQSGLLKIKGVKMFELDDKKMTLTVFYNPQKTSLDQIRRAISKLGYDADAVKADASAYEKLDGCCKKT